MIKGKFAMQSKRLLTSSPKELLSFNSKELLEAIKLSEARTIVAIARTRGPNICDGVSNAEMCAAFGADIIYNTLYDPRNPYIPGLPSKKPKEPDDEILSQVQVDLGRGWTLRDLRELIGRPVGIQLFGTEKSYMKGQEAHMGRLLASREIARLMVEQGADIIDYTEHVALGDLELIGSTIKELRDEIKDKAILSFSRIHGEGQSDIFSKKGVITEDEIRVATEEGVDIVGIPAVGTSPGYTLEFTSKLVNFIHDCGALAHLVIGTSQEGTDIETVRRIGFYSKMTGAEMYGLSGAGLSEAMPTPENIMALSIAIRGKRHTYRRMAMSPLR